jgi:hypothetical protein
MRSGDLPSVQSDSGMLLSTILLMPAAAICASLPSSKSAFGARAQPGGSRHTSQLSASGAQISRGLLAVVAPCRRGAARLRGGAGGRCELRKAVAEAPPVPPILLMGALADMLHH